MLAAYERSGVTDGVWLIQLDWAEVILSPIGRILVSTLGFAVITFSAVALTMAPQVLSLFG
ncbi:hypothetical protein [Marinivivus vitaminiproducens]|uniref:hypothetical protein n=1 Tax=Marinivivus vitaminiproducens TaxID=3035935 RepID=UPI0027A53830|nr:hypothetical protein P4R82_24920 [Geminicoccaceae bacterium SCSIO 64248]